MTQQTRPSRQEFYDRLSPRSLAPLWEVMSGLLPPEPTSKAAPHRWSYDDVRPLLLEAADLLTAKEAERRVLVLENPSFPGQSKVTASLYAGLQVILPGETAPAHRHTPSALRLMLEGDGAYTSVGGERTRMRMGDFVITPSWSVHDHGNDGDDPAIWLDGLDVPIASFFEAIFREDYNDEQQSLTRPEGDALARFGSGLLPLNAVSPFGQTTPIFNYPYERTREALLAASRGADPDPHLATTLRFANPIDGGWTMPTMSAWMTYVPAGTTTTRLRSTEGIVMCLVEGRGAVAVGDKRLAFEPRDVIAAPVWSWRSFTAAEDCFVFCFSDRVAQEKLGIFRETRAAA